MERVCAPLRYHPCATVTKVVGTTNFPPPSPRRGTPLVSAGSGPPGARSPAGSRDADDARPAFVERASIFPDPPRGAFQHVAVFKNILVAADGDASAPPRLRRPRLVREAGHPRRRARPRAPSTAPPPLPRPRRGQRARVRRHDHRRRHARGPPAHVAARGARGQARLRAPAPAPEGGRRRRRPRAPRPGPAPAHRVQRRQAHVRVLGARHGEAPRRVLRGRRREGRAARPHRGRGIGDCVRARLRRRLLVRNDLRRRRIRTRRRAPRR